MTKAHTIKMLIIGLSLSLLGGCGNFLKPHKISIQQGNLITRNMLTQLEQGQTKKQVKYILGTPLIKDTFAPDEWYYRYSFRLGTGEELVQLLKLSFVDDALVSIFSDPPVSQYTEGGDDPEQQLLSSESEKLEKALPTEIEDSQNEAGL